MVFEEIGDNIFRIEVPLPQNPLRLLNAYLVRADEKNPGWRGRSLLIDNGFNKSECGNALRESLHALGVPLTSLDFLVTHLHADHCGLTSALLKEAGPEAWVFASSGDGASINKMTRQSFRFARFFASMLVNDMPYAVYEDMVVNHPGAHDATDAPLPFTPLEEDDLFSYGGHNLRIISMPGHTPDLITVYDETDKLYFSSDHVLGDITPNIAHWDSVPDSLGSYLASLEKADRLDVSVCLPGHRNYFADFHGRIRALQHHHAQRLDDTRAILADIGSAAAYTVASRMRWSIRAKSWEDFPNAQKWFACSEARSHLVHLEVIGDAKSTIKNGITYYSLL